MKHAIPPQAETAEQAAPQFFLEASAMWEGVYADLEAAKTSIDFEQYILNDDAVGRRFLQLFADKAKQGVAIRILVDRVGSRSIFDHPLVKEIEANGGAVHFYNGHSWLNIFVPWKWFPRNHTKVIVIDSDIVYIGSACFHEIMTHWRDTQVRLEGILVNDIKAEFQLTWNNVIERKRKKQAFFSSPPDQHWRYAVSQPFLARNPIYRELLRRIKAATNEIYLVTPYFVPPWPLRRALKRAIKRGVVVNVMMGEVTDIPMADRVSRSYFPRLFKYGVNLYLYQKTVLHTKYAIIDDAWATIGSTNMDYLSLLHNREANAITTDKGIVAQLKGHFKNDLNECIKADMAYWKKISLWNKIVGYLGRVIRRFL